MFIGPQAMLFSEAKTAEFALLVARTILAAPVSPNGVQNLRSDRIFTKCKEKRRDRAKGVPMFSPPIVILRLTFPGCSQAAIILITCNATHSKPQLPDALSTSAKLIQMGDIVPLSVNATHLPTMCQLQGCE